ncbi:MAG: DUF2769 domain-containing protein [Candidatus Heimdallarchaeota archaeon]|nr:MAG: DUF2769 domain-containing protein [Candidatus Heimdallarchaeota archaeon]
MTSDDERFPTASFEEKFKMFAVMTDSQREAAAENVIHFCKDYCGKCPTNQGTGETARAFCSLGKSEVIQEQKGCLCGQCPISKTMSLRWDYYCTQGKALELSEAERR